MRDQHFAGKKGGPPGVLRPAGGASETYPRRLCGCSGWAAQRTGPRGGSPGAAEPTQAGEAKRGTPRGEAEKPDALHLGPEPRGCGLGLQWREGAPAGKTSSKRQEAAGRRLASAPSYARPGGRVGFREPALLPRSQPWKTRRPTSSTQTRSPSPPGSGDMISERISSAKLLGSGCGRPRTGGYLSGQ